MSEKVKNFFTRPMTLITIIGIACVPALYNVSFLTSIGILTPVFLTRYRRYAYFVLLVLAVVLTPADFISDLAMTAPLILLYEVSVTLSKLIYKRKQRKYKDK